MESAVGPTHIVGESTVLEKQFIKLIYFDRF